MKIKDPEERRERWLKRNHVIAVHLTNRQEFILQALEAGLKLVEQGVPNIEYVPFPELAPLRRDEKLYVKAKLLEFESENAEQSNDR